jgi:SAM-dependent methyltransferase
MRKNTLLFFMLISSLFLYPPSHASFDAKDDVINTMDKWLDPSLNSNKKNVIEIIRNQTPKLISCSKEEEQGFSFAPNIIHSMILEFICMRYKKGEGKRIDVLDLGCGYGYLSLLMILAGGKVRGVEKQLNIAKEANEYIFKKTKEILKYNPKNSKEYYSVLHQDIVGEKVTWTNTEHEIVLCDNLIHFLKPEECKRLAQRLYKNMLKGGIALITSDTPFYHKSWIEFYENAKKKESSYPGYAVYSKKRDQELQFKKEIIGNPVDVSEELQPGKLYPGAYLGKNDIIDIDKSYHTVKNYFKTEDLGAVFSEFGFKVPQTCYVDSVNNILQEYDLKIGGQYRACVFLTK